MSSVACKVRIGLALLVMQHAVVTAAELSAGDVQARMDADGRAGRPLVVHVVVALCDNEYQGIIPVPASLGDGDKPATNLYWGARYGVRTFFSRSERWQRLVVEQSTDARILERAAFKAVVMRRGTPVTAYLIAEAWRGRNIEPAIARFLELASGRDVERLRVGAAADPIEITAGGAAHLVAYIGHDGLMDFPPPPLRSPVASAPARSSIVLACYSQRFFGDSLATSGAHTLLTTTGLMAPEAYTLEAAILAWFAGESETATVTAAAAAYARYQNANPRWARRLFGGDATPDSPWPDSP